MKKPHEYIEDAASVCCLFDQAHDAEAHWSRIAEAAVVLSQQDAQREIDRLKDQLNLNAEALTLANTRNGPDPRTPLRQGQPDEHPPF